MNMEKCIVFGTGIVGKRVVKQLSNFGIKPVAISDNNSSLWGKEIGGIPIISPESINNFLYDIILISTSDYYDIIYNQLVNDLKINSEKVKYWDIFLKEEFISYYSGIYNMLDNEKKQIYKEVLKTSRLEVFNYPFSQKYNENDIIIEKDAVSDLLYYNYNGHKMYLSRSYNTIDKAKKYICSILMEQDQKSPHRYTDETFTFDGGVILDAGVAEGNFSLDLVDKAEHIIIVEADARWIEALNYTFAPYKDKVTIINKYLSNIVDNLHITIDEICRESPIDFIKMDIEGAEIEALKGAYNTIKDKKCGKFAVCAYHNIEDENSIRHLLENTYNTTTTDGYMLFPYNENQMVRMVRGVVRAERK